MLARRGALTALRHLHKQSRNVSTTPDPFEDFYSIVQVRDLPDSSPQLELLRKHNSSFPKLQDQLVVGKISKVEKDYVWFDVGFKSLTRFAKKELHVNQLVKSKDPGLRTSATDFRVGDVLHLILEEVETPYGDMMLRSNKPRDVERLPLLWKELEEHYKARKPVLGRILNAVNKGYAVGIAGIVGFCPFSRSSVLTASKVGLLQPFIIEQMAPERLNLVVTDLQMANRPNRPQPYQQYRGDQGSFRRPR